MRDEALTDQRQRSRRGCLFYALVVGGLLAGVLLVGALAGFSMARRMLNQFTSAQPVTLAPIRLSAAEQDDLSRRVAAFRQAIGQQHATAPLSLTSDELNFLLLNSPEAGPLTNEIRLRVEGGEVKGDLSIPMAQLGLPMFKNRYLNATAVLGVGMQDGRLRVIPEHIFVKGKELPGVYLNKLRGLNLAERANMDPTAAATLARLQEIQVREGRVVIVPKNSR